jgi:hypothetical protein
VSIPENVGIDQGADRNFYSLFCMRTNIEGVGLSEDGTCGQDDLRVLSVREFMLGNSGDPDTWRGESFAVG